MDRQARSLARGQLPLQALTVIEPPLHELLTNVRRRLAAASPAPWRVERTDDDPVFIRTGGTGRIFLKRDSANADESDYAFVAAARNGLPALVEAAESGQRGVPDSELQALLRLADSATPGPWTPHIEDSGPIGGCSVIWVDGTNAVPDLYVWLEDEIAPNGDVEFIAHARQDVPRLVDELLREL